MPTMPDHDSKLHRLARLGRVAGGIVHDLRNPLTTIRSSVYLLRRRLDGDPAASRHLDKIAAQIDASEQLIERMLDLARGRPPRRSVVAVDPWIDACLATARVPETVVVRRQGTADAALWVDGELLGQALVNLALNAVQAQDDAGEIEISLAFDGPDATLVVGDSGPGFDPDLLASVFEPLTTGRERGTGFGLALVEMVVEHHGGAVRASNRSASEGGGARLELSLPSAAPPDSSPGEPS